MTLLITHKPDGARHVHDLHSSTGSKYAGYSRGMYASGRTPPNYPPPAIKTTVEFQQDPTYRDVYQVWTEYTEGCDDGRWWCAHNFGIVA